MTDDLLTQARAFLAEERARLAGEFEVTRPTPTQPECDLAAAGEIVMRKRWDLSPIDPASFDPAEPPGRPEGGPPPSNSVAPTVTVIGGLMVGEMVVVSGGTWTGAPTLTRQWKRGATNIGAGATSYTLVALDVGQMISCDVTATNAGGSATASSNAVGPVTDGAQHRQLGRLDGRLQAPARR
jgi:hypothetical protein